MLQLKRVETESEWTQFIDLPWELYQGNPYWVPPLKRALRELLDVNKNPFFRHAYMYPLLAFKDGRCCGRIVGIIDDHHNRFHKEHTAFFGFFECTDDPKIAERMIREVGTWACGRGMDRLRGPMNPSTNHECGLLVEGFEDSPTVMMPYNLSYYGRLLEKCGLAKVKDLYAYSLDSRTVRFPDKVLAQVERLKQGGVARVRPIQMRKFDQELERILSIYNDAWEANWGFVPMDEEEFRYLAKDLKRIIDPNLVLILEMQGEPAAFALTLPDINQALRKLRDGKVFPSGLVKLLWDLKGPFRRKTVNRLRIVTLGVRRAYREYGLGPLLYSEYLRRAIEQGYLSGEASWILEDNQPMNQALMMMGAERSKVYRLYDRSLAD